MELTEESTVTEFVEVEVYAWLSQREVISHSDHQIYSMPDIDLETVEGNKENISAEEIPQSSDASFEDFP